MRPFASSRRFVDAAPESAISSPLIPFSVAPETPGTNVTSMYAPDDIVATLTLAPFAGLRRRIDGDGGAGAPAGGGVAGLYRANDVVLARFWTPATFANDPGRMVSFSAVALTGALIEPVNE